MAVKTVYQIDVNDSAFARFKAQFEDYEKKLQGSPGLWAKTTTGVAGTVKSFQELVAAQIASIGQQKLMAEAQKEALKRTKETETATASISRNFRNSAEFTKQIAGNVVSVTTTLLRWASIGGALSGLLGAGGLFGLDALAGGVGATRRSAQGVGASYGEQKAFGLNFGRYVDTDALTGGVNEALTDPRKYYALIGAGAKQDDIKSGDAVKVAASLIPQLKQIADSTKDQYLALEIEKRGLQGIVSVETLRRLKATSPEELAKAQQSYGADVKGLGLDDKSARVWQDFAVQMSRAGQQIENVLVKGLIGLAGPLTSLSESVVKSIQSLVSSPKLGEWIKEFGAGIESAAKYVGSDDFQKDVKSFADGVASLAESIVSALRFLGAIPKREEDKTEFDRAAEANRKAGGGFWSTGRLGQWWNGTLNQGGGSAQAPIPGQAPDADSTLALFRKLEHSGDSAVSPKGAIGRYQITPDTARTYGADPSRLTDPDYNTATAKKILTDLAAKYNGDLEAMEVAYNAGPRRADRWIRGGRDDSTLPKETRDYLANGRVQVTIMNQTGSNIVVTQSQLPQ